MAPADNCRPATEVTGKAVSSGRLSQSVCGHEGVRPDFPALPLTLIFRSQYRQLVRFCRIRVRNQADAEDIVQAAFLNARRAYPDKGIDELRPLLFTLVRNCMFNFLKSADHRRQQASREIGEVGDQVACQRTVSPEQQLIDAERLALVEALMEAMPARRREALRLHRLEGLTHTEIATRLSITRQTVMIDIAEAVAELAEGLARAEGGRISRPEASANRPIARKACKSGVVNGK
ncbi:ECF subfamily RNA polymerase sigma factor [Hyphomonas polymorpha PS728]|uniref:ECF subfamily RNA polymerase sigma factor n=1 Tax=Hyphomonas polymorpha PS728 TaxID=1280954 RepID=A0A062VB85_9PROT|nr:ECF subfamily RNA polymerase sigma factor [Hyphomonas polymorpha PS728]